jgi:uncharacterized protein (TIGR00255 family)
MTGFGEASSQVGGVHYFVEVRSLNSKFLKAVIRLPDAYQGLEAEMETAIRRRLARGTVTLTASCTDVTEGAALEVNQKALEKYVEQLRRVAQAGQGAAPGMGGLSIDLAALLSLPGVLQPPTDEEARLHKARAAFLPLLDRACDGLIKMREVEGRTLQLELVSHYDLIAGLLKKIAERGPAVVREYETRLKARIDMMLQQAELRVDPVELIREIAVYAEKTDIAEEISRLSGHMEQFHQLITSTSDKPVGRTLDFLTQEMLREANTIASKSPDAEISRATVEVKGAIDRIKEQVQNVE